MNLGKTEKKILNILKNNQYCNEKFLRRAVRRKSSLGRELKRLEQKKLIAKRINIDGTKLYTLTKAGKDLDRIPTMNMEDSKIMNLIRDITNASIMDSGGSGNQPVFTTNEEIDLIKKIKVSTKYKNKDTRKFIRIIERFDLDASDIFDIGTAWRMKEDDEMEDALEIKEDDFKHIRMSDRDFWFVGKISDQFTKT